MRIRRERDRKFPKDIKATKTTQLRSIALAEKVNYTPHDLWQMPKFKNNAKPTLDTFRKRSPKSKMAANGTGSGFVDSGFSYRCPEEQDGKEQYVLGDEFQPREFDLNDYTGGEYVQTTHHDCLDRDSPLSVELN